MCNGSLSSLNLSGLPSLPSTTSVGRMGPPGLDNPPASGRPHDAGELYSTVPSLLRYTIQEPKVA